MAWCRDRMLILRYRLFLPNFNTEIRSWHNVKLVVTGYTVGCHNHRHMWSQVYYVEWEACMTLSNVKRVVARRRDYIAFYHVNFRSKLICLPLSPTRWTQTDAWKWISTGKPLEMINFLNSYHKWRLLKYSSMANNVSFEYHTSFSADFAHVLFLLCCFVL